MSFGASPFANFHVWIIMQRRSVLCAVGVTFTSEFLQAFPVFQVPAVVDSSDKITFNPFNLLNVLYFGSVPNRAAVLQLTPNNCIVLQRVFIRRGERVWNTLSTQAATFLAEDNNTSRHILDILQERRHSDSHFKKSYFLEEQGGAF